MTMKTIEELVLQGILKPYGLNLHGYAEFERSSDRSRVIMVPAGPFIMGSIEEESTEVEKQVPWYKASVAECPQWKPYIGTYLIDRFEVTSEQFAQFLNAIDARSYHDDNLRGTLAAVNSSNHVLCYDARDFVERRGIPNSQHAIGVWFTGSRWEPIPGTEICPVVLVTWLGAAEYARWVEFDLPTEMQWEKAARGTDSRQFPWGDTYDPQFSNTADRWLGVSIFDQAIWDALFYRNGYGEAWLASRPLPVGSIPQGSSPYGCDDMIGNVAEWCSTFYLENAYALYAEDGVEFTHKVVPTTFRCMRGAGRYGYAAISRCACRRRRDPQSASENLGFRCALSLDSTEATLG